MKYLGYEFTIVSKGTELTEYQIEFDDEKKRATCWIASKAGQEFSIHWTVLQGAPYVVACFPKVDGVKVNAINNSIKKGYAKFNLKGIPVSTTSLRPFQFTSLETTDDDAYLHADDVKHIGEITAEIWEVSLGEARKQKFTTIPNTKVHERAKKATAHRIGFGDAQVRSPTRTTATTKIRRIVEFVVKYRNLDILQADGIAPQAARRSTAKVGEKRNAENEALEEKEDDDASQVKDEAELKALLARVDTLQSRLASNGKQKDSNKRVKTEARPVKISNEIIDLTED